MDAVILAAGLGSRLRAAAPSKPLARVADVPLIEHAVRGAAQAGAQRIVVATGYGADAVEASLAELSQRIQVPIEARRVGDWTRPNGYSVLAAAGDLAGDFLLLMADHLFDLAILRGLACAGRPEHGVTLAIDRRTAHPDLDPEDATWVRTGPEGSIVAIGKTIDRYDAVDCGAFLATAGLVAAIGEAIATGRPGSLSDGMQVLADRGRATTFDVGAARWIDVDDPRALALAEAWLADTPASAPVAVEA